MKSISIIGTTLILCFSLQNAIAEEFEVGQKNKAFTVKTLEIKVGDVVSFPNHDPFFHNIFSLSEVETFDLGSYKQGNTKRFTFNNPGKIEVECAIHPKMQMVITVK